MIRVATCACGQLSVTCTGEPMRVSICHCLDCKRRSGSAFTYQARWPDERVAMQGDFHSWSRAGESGVATFRFCPTCGSTVTYSHEGMPGLTAVAVGAFGEPGFPTPEYSVYEGRKHEWITIVGDIEQYD